MTVEGRLARCSAISRGAQGAAFDAATLATAPLFRLKPMDSRDAADWPPGVDRRFRIRIAWSAAASGVEGVPTLPLPPRRRDAAGKPLVGTPTWAKFPDPGTLDRYYPERALRLEKDGSTIIACTVTGEGLFENCVPVSEHPAEMGFGAAGVRAMRLFRLNPLDSAGEPVEGVATRQPFQWKMSR